MRCAGAGSPFGMGQRGDSWSQEKSLWISPAKEKSAKSSAQLSLFPAEIRSVSKQKELNELQLPLGVLQEVPLSFVKLITAVS